MGPKYLIRKMGNGRYLGNGKEVNTYIGRRKAKGSSSIQVI